MERGLTQEAFAALLRVSERYVRRIEAGEKNLTLTSMARLASRLEVPLVELLSAPRAKSARRR